MSASGIFSCIRARAQYFDGEGDTQGSFPTIAAAQKSEMIIVIYRSVHSNTLLYGAGQLDLKHGQINWRTKRDAFDTGEHPHVTITKSTIVIAVYNREQSNELVCHIGNLDVANGKVKWDAQQTTYGNGSKPALQVIDAIQL